MSNWFLRLCRNTGLMVHHATHPTRREVLDKKVQEQKLNDTVTLRRTTIDEIEIKQSPK